MAVKSAPPDDKGATSLAGERRSVARPGAAAAPSLEMLADRPIADDGEDRLGFGPYADAFAELIDNPRTSTPLTLALSAPWGAGKSSLANMIAHRLEQWPERQGRPPHIVCWFNAWLHDDAPDLGAALAADVAKSLNRHRGWRRLLRPLPTAMLSSAERARRQVWLGAGALALAIAALLVVLTVPSAAALLPDVDMTGVLAAGGLGAAATGVAVLAVLWRRVFAAAQAVASFVDDPASESAKGSMAQVRAQLGGLVADVTGGRLSLIPSRRMPRRLVVFVDDLERCRSPRALDVCEVVNQLLGHPGVVVVLLADMSIVMQSAQVQYGAVGANGQGSSPLEYGRRYLQKIVQLQFDLPIPEAPDVAAMLQHETSAPANRTIGLWQALRQPALLGKIVAVAAGAGVLLRYLHRRYSAEASSITLGGDTHSSTYTDWLSVLLIMAPLVAVAGWYLWRELLRARRRLQTRRLRAAILERSSADLEERLEPDLVPLGDDAAVVHQLLQRYVTDDSVFRREAEGEAMRHLPPVPRAAKRMLNHLRLLLVIAVGRGMFGGQPELTPAHLGKWVVLAGRWPDVAQAVVADPSVMAALETPDGLRTICDALQLADRDGEMLADFLGSGLRLGGVAARLVAFSPADGAAASPSRTQLAAP